MKKKEYGGYLPLELNRKTEYFNYDNDCMIRLNCGRSAILCAVFDAGYKKIHLPFYTCQSVSEACRQYGVPYEYYHIDDRFRPLHVRLKEDEAILWTNYFGIGSRNREEQIAAEYGNVILDHTQAFFAEPVMDVYNAYSCRKFFGVSDGAYLIHRGLRQRELQQDVSSPTAQYLMQSVEAGTNAAYHSSLENEKRVERAGILQMSELTRQILQSVEYETVKKVRKQNFFYLHQRLKALNQLDALADRADADGGYRMQDEVPMVYPFLYECDGLREYLISHCIYVPQWWKWVAGSPDAGAFERTLSQYLFALPIDQRYDEADMEQICRVILNYV